MKSRTRVLVVDDHVMIRMGLVEAINAESDMKVVGQAGNGEEALEVYAKSRPDVVIMDFQMPGPDGAATTQRLREEHPDARVLLLSMYEGEEHIWRSVEAGVMGYLPKSSEADDILCAIRHLIGGDTYFLPGIAVKLEARRKRDTLSPRELQVLQEIVAGRSNKEIVEALGISEATVKLHISNVLAKLSVLDRTQAAIEALRQGIIHLDK
jgi:DNA-binding NarL/FixJ family response regulator